MRTFAGKWDMNLLAKRNHVVLAENLSQSAYGITPFFKKAILNSSKGNLPQNHALTNPGFVVSL